MKGCQVSMDFLSGGFYRLPYHISISRRNAYGITVQNFTRVFDELIGKSSPRPDRISL